MAACAKNIIINTKRVCIHDLVLVITIYSIYTSVGVTNKIVPVKRIIVLLADNITVIKCKEFFTTAKKMHMVHYKSSVVESALRNILSDIVL